MAVLTLGVFFLLQNYGPESAVRRLNAAIQTRDLDAFSTLTVPSGPLDERTLLGAVGPYLRPEGQYRVIYTDGQNDRAETVVEYRAPGLPVLYVRYVSVRERNRWRVDVAQSLHGPSSAARQARS